ncbi:E3 ubiquitin-protein ligase Midline-1-like isoform X2 [Gigantopelta aegis]|nr:E3 ubiquitin-protein ligase Midline-1-like isoform X2 [Gigantopelta aegis]
MDLDRDLRCPICLEFFSHPMILPCSHVLCRKPCAENLFSFNFIRCPVCRESCYVNGGLETLPRVFALENIIDKFKAGGFRKSKTHLESRDSSSERAQCNLCCEQSQAERKKAKTVSRIHCSSSSCISVPRCARSTDHLELESGASSVSTEDRPMFCSTCQQLCCQQHLQQHVLHAVIPIEEAYAKFKMSVEQNVVSLWEGRSRVQAVLTEVEEDTLYLQSVIRRKRDEVNEQCDALLSEVENKREFFLADLDCEERMRRHNSDDVTKILQSVLSSAKDLCKYSRDVLSADPATFLEVAPGLQTQLITTALECASCHAPPPEDERLNSKIVDLRNQRKMLAAISYLTPPESPRIDVSKCSRSDSVVALVVLPPCACQVDEYVVHYHTDKQACLGLEDTVSIATDNTPTSSNLPKHMGDHVILLDNLQSASTYYFNIYARNAAGKSGSSEIVQCCTLRHTESVVPIPVIIESLCHSSETSASLHSTSPFDVSVEQGIDHRLLYRQTGMKTLWNSETFLGDEVHTVHGLDSNTEYEFVLLAANLKGECQLSNTVVLHTLALL